MPETIPNLPAEGVAVNEATAPAPVKKTRVRRQSAVAEAVATAAPVVTEKPAKAPTRRKPGNQGSAANLASVAAKAAAVKGPPKAKPAQPTVRPPAAVDEMTELLQLEEENKKLRKALSEKLRAENADLRKRLGMD